MTLCNGLLHLPHAAKAKVEVGGRTKNAGRTGSLKLSNLHSHSLSYTKSIHLLLNYLLLLQTIKAKMDGDESGIVKLVSALLFHVVAV